MVNIRFRLANRRSRVAAPTKTKAIFTSSEGWKERGPMEIQFFAPKIRSPSTTLKASRTPAATATGHRARMDICRLRSTPLISRNSTMPMTTVHTSFNRESGS